METEIKALAQSRVDELRREHPDISVDCIVQDTEEGERAVILYTEYDFNPMGFDFIESETSWKRPRVIEEYNGLVGEGYCVVVYVPEKVLSDVAKMLKERGGRSNIRLYSQERLFPRIKC